MPQGNPPASVPAGPSGRPSATALPFAVILVMAGAGTRFGAEAPKAFVPLAGRAMWRHAADAIARARGLVAVVFVVPASHVDAMRKDVADLGVTAFVVAGGERRQDSVRLGLAAVPSGARVVAVHDAARPLATAAIFEDVVRAASIHGAAIAAVPVRDTLKRVGEDGVIGGTVSRTSLWHAQTPQAFRTEFLRAAHAHAVREDLEATDDAQLVEATGVARVRVVIGDRWNIKVTEPSDAQLVEALLAAHASRSATSSGDVRGRVPGAEVSAPGVSANRGGER